VKFLVVILLLALNMSAFSLQNEGHTHYKYKDQMTKEQVARTLETAGFPREIVPVVTCIAELESNFRPRAINRHNTNSTIDHGLLQINDIWKSACKLSESDLSNPLKNAKCALKIYNLQGLTAWVTYQKNKQKCLAYQVPNYNTTKIAEIIIKNSDLM
jgi:hypothetical protein